MIVVVVKLLALHFVSQVLAAFTVSQIREEQSVATLVAPLRALFDIKRLKHPLLHLKVDFHVVSIVALVIALWWSVTFTSVATTFKPMYRTTSLLL